MSRYSNTGSKWANGYSSTGKPTCYALICESQSVGKRVKSTKRRILWKVVLTEDAESGKSTTQNIELKHSVVSGKRGVYFNGRLIHESKNNISQKVDFEHSWRSPRNHLLRVVIKEETDRFIYSLSVDGVPFRRLPKFEQFQAQSLAHNVDHSLRDNAFGEKFENDGDASGPAVSSSWTTFGDGGKMGDEGTETSSEEEGDFDPFNNSGPSKQSHKQDQPVASSADTGADEFDPFGDAGEGSAVAATPSPSDAGDFDPFGDAQTSGVSPPSEGEDDEFDPFGDNESPTPAPAKQPQSTAFGGSNSFDPFAAPAQAPAPAPVPAPVPAPSASSFDLNSLYAPSPAPQQPMGMGMGMGMNNQQMGAQQPMYGGMQAGYGVQQQRMGYGQQQMMGGYTQQNMGFGGQQQNMGGFHQASQQQQMRGFSNQASAAGFGQQQQHQPMQHAPAPAPAPAPQADFNPFDDF